MEFRQRWAPLVIVAAYSVALLIPALMPSVQAKDVLPPMGVMATADLTADIRADDMAANDAMMAALHEQASTALRELQTECVFKADAGLVAVHHDREQDRRTAAVTAADLSAACRG